MPMRMRMPCHAMSCHVIVMSRQRSLILESVTLVSHRIREQSRRDADTVTDYPVSYDVIENECGACCICCRILLNEAGSQERHVGSNEAI